MTTEIRYSEESVTNDGPVRVLMSAGKWLVPASSRPRLRFPVSTGTDGLPKAKRAAVGMFTEARGHCKTCGAEFVGTRGRKYCDRHSESIHKRGKA